MGRDKGLSRTRVVLRHLGMQGSRVVLLACFVLLSGLAAGYVFAFPLRYVEYESDGAVRIDQQALAGEVEVSDALVAPTDLSATWEAADPTLSGFGVLGADVCGTPVDLPTPLSPKEGAVYLNPTDDTTLISQAIRVEKSRSAVEYLDDVREELDKCQTFYQEIEGDRIRTSSDPVDREPPISDHVTRRYTSANGVQEWSMMVVGDVIIAIQYGGPAPPPPNFLSELEWSILRRVAPEDFALPGESVPEDGGVPTDGESLDPPTGSPDAGDEPVVPDGGGNDSTDSPADESGGP